MAPTKAQRANALVTFYLGLYTDHYRDKPFGFNRYRDKWGFEAMIDDLGYDLAKDVITYYFTTSRYGHPTKYLLYNYDVLNKDMRDAAEDEQIRIDLRADSKVRVEQWKAEHGE